MTTTLDKGWLQEASAALSEANLDFNDAHPGGGAGPQPVHTVYGGAQLFSSDTTVKLGRVAEKAMADYAPDAEKLGRALGISDHPALTTIDQRVREKLSREPVEDYRIDFEDGYGNRPDAEEDGHAEAVVRELAKGMKEKPPPPFIGMRIKPLNEELRHRSIRTLDIVLTGLVKAGAIPAGWVIPVPKITILEQVEFFRLILEQLEVKLGLEIGVLQFEAMVETPQII